MQRRCLKKRLKRRLRPMSDLSDVTELLEKDCFCHNSQLDYMFECMPGSIKQPRVRKDCNCYHAQEAEIKETLLQFKKFLETQGRFKLGDRVELNYTPVITATDSWGWLSNRHFLIKGALATVVEISYWDNEFHYLLQFDGDTSWIGENNIIHPKDDPTHRHNFSFPERRLDKVGSYVVCNFLRQLWSDFYKIGD